MSFQGLQATYRGLFRDSTAWKLLRADNAPYILAFIEDLFADESEVSYGRARIILDAHIEKSRELDIWQTETSASAYLNQWINSGWLRGMDDMLTKTDASEVALRFCQSLDERRSGATAAHLRIVQEAVRDLAAALSPDAAERVTLLEGKKAEIQRQIDVLQRGVVAELSEMEQRERIREIYQLASVLTGDFRRVEEEIRRLDKELRKQIILDDTSRGDVLLCVMEKEMLLSSTDAGSAFEGFYQLLCDPHKSTELREQLRSVLSRPAAAQLTANQQKFLSRLLRELARESEQVFNMRKRTQERLRSYLESGATAENRAVEQLLSKLEKLAVLIHEEQIDLKTPTSLSLSVGLIKIRSPDSMRLKSLDDKIDTSGVEEKVNTHVPSMHVLNSLEAVQVKEIADRARQTLQMFGPMSISGIASHQPLISGLEELVAYLRVAKAVGATALEQKEQIDVQDKLGNTLRASIPIYLLSADLFPPDMDELVL